MAHAQHAVQHGVRLRSTGRSGAPRAKREWSQGVSTVVALLPLVPAMFLLGICIYALLGSAAFVFMPLLLLLAYPLWMRRRSSAESKTTK